MSPQRHSPFLRSRQIARGLFLAAALALVGAAVCLAQTRSTSPDRPKLVLLIAIDQFRYDYMPRFRDQYSGGIARLLSQGANFVNAHLEHYPTVTAIGHATMMSGATPAISGIIGNDWYDRTTQKQVTSVSDDSTSLLGSDDVRKGSSPRRLLVSTVGDEIKRVSPGSKVFGVSLKDRSAILPAGHMADGAYWFHDPSGAFVTSTYYTNELPAWVQEFNNRHETSKFADQVWLPAGEGQLERRIPRERGRLQNAAVYGSIFGNDLLRLFAEAAIAAEKLGTRGVTDVLTISFSSNDAVGHTYGPDSPEARAISIAVDKTLGSFFEYLDKTIGMDNVLVLLTADHGVSPVPEVLAKQKMPGGRLIGDFFAPIKKALEARYGPGLWVVSTAGTSPYLNYALIEEKKLDPEEVTRVAARAIAAVPHVMRVYTRQQLLTTRTAADMLDSRVIRSFSASRSGDLEVLLEPYWIRGSGSGTTHGTAYNYDSHIPLVFMGPGIRPGRYYQAAALNDAAPTIAALIDVEIPSGSVGRVLSEMIETAAPPRSGAASRTAR